MNQLAPLRPNTVAPKEVADQRAVGNTRHPERTVACLSHALEAGQAVRDLLLPFFKRSGVLQSCSSAVGSDREDAGLSPDIIKDARVTVSQLVGATSIHPLQSEIHNCTLCANLLHRPTDVRKEREKKKWAGWKPKTDEQTMEFRKKVMDTEDDLATFQRNIKTAAREVAHHTKAASSGRIFELVGRARTSKSPRPGCEVDGGLEALRREFR